MTLDRREFLRLSAGLAGSAGLPLRFLQGQGATPSRDWEKVYRAQYKYDSSFTFVCAPNDTHACRLRAFVRNGVVMRTEPNYDAGRITDLGGNAASGNWNPRTCAKGYAFPRRLYGPYRLKSPLVRKGWKDWADAGFPYLTPELRTKFKFDARAADQLVPATWDDAAALAAKGLAAIAKLYSGDEGKRRLLDEGYVPEVVDAAEGSGVRCMKFCGGPALTGVIGRQGMHRFASMLALLDATVRGVPEAMALGGRTWDDAGGAGGPVPGHSFVHGLSAPDGDLNALRLSRLHVHVGGSLLDGRVADAHWYVESIERGARIWHLSPEYSAAATKANRWMPVRPGSEAAVFLFAARQIIEGNQFDRAFVLRHTDLPLLVRTDTLKRLRPSDFDPAYKNKDLSKGPGMTLQGLTPGQREKLGDFMVWDAGAGKAVPVSRDDVGGAFEKLGIKAALEGRFTVVIGGAKVEVAPILELYRQHLKDYDLATVAEITGAPKPALEAFARELAETKPLAIHAGEGVDRAFHATEIHRAIFLPLMLTGNVGVAGAGAFAWGGNARTGIFPGSAESGAGLRAWSEEDPFHPVLDPAVDGKEIKPRRTTRGESSAFWSTGDRPLMAGKKVLTGRTHLPTPTKVLWFSASNPLNSAPAAYEVIRGVLPKAALVMGSDIEMTASIEYADIVFPANSWAELQQPELAASGSNPFLQVWGGGGLKPLADSRDDVMILAAVAKALGDATGDKRCAEYWKFALEGKAGVYLQRILDASATTRGYKLAEILAGKHGEPGAALMNFRTSPRTPFWEMVKEDQPFFTPTGRLQAYNDEPEMIAAGENFIVHREGPEATPYLPNVIVSSNPLVRPEASGLPEGDLPAEQRQLRNIRKPWAEVKETKNTPYDKGRPFVLLSTRSPLQGGSVDWMRILGSNFGDPARPDARTPHSGEAELHMNPKAADDIGINDGDYVYVDADPLPEDAFSKVARLMLRVRYSPGFPYNTVMLPPSANMATERSVKAAAARPDGRALSEGTGYQAAFRSGSGQSLVRPWLMPLHQIDSLFRRSKDGASFVFGGEGADSMLGTARGETLVKVTKAEDGHASKSGPWRPGTTGRSPGNENTAFQRYIQGELTIVEE